MSRIRYARVLGPVAVLAWATSGVAADEPTIPDRLVKIDNRRMLIRECTLPGETRADDVVPGRSAAVRASRDRWLIVYGTRGWRGVDDERSVVYQLRQGGPDGKLIKEGFLARSRNDWQPLGDGTKCVKQHGHSVICGVPKGAWIDGRPAPNANLFVVKWRVLGVPYDPVKKAVLRNYPKLREGTQAVEWAQVRLSKDESDIEIVQPVQVLRQKGFEKGAAFCTARVGWMNQSFVPPVPFNRACTEWADVNHFDGGRIAALKLTFNPAVGRYEWTETGPLTGGAGLNLGEASLVANGTRWLVAARVFGGRKGGIAWAQTDNPFRTVPNLTVAPVPPTDSPLTVFRCADGVLRLFTGDASASPRRRTRDPLYTWDIRAGKDGIRLENRRLVFDSVKEGVKFRHEAWPRVDFALFYPAHGKTQVLTYRVSTRAYHFPYDTRPIPAITAEEKTQCGNYYTVLTYANVVADPWTFPDR